MVATVSGPENQTSTKYESRRDATAMGRILGFLFGVIAYAGFMAWMVYMIGFLGVFAVPKSVDSGSAAPAATAIFVDFLLIFIFGVQHTIMARPAFKQWWTQYIPKPFERSIFVFISDIIAWVMVWQWRPIEGVIWHVQNTAAANLLIAVSLLGWVATVLSSFMINHFELLGLEQVWHHLRGTEPKKITFKQRGFYKYVRHPLMLGFLVFFWVTPYMTASHLLFAALFTTYVLIGIRFEERDLMKYHPHDYGKYKKAVPALIPFTKR
jgi:methanethiol S-methyltransferase